MKRTNENDRYVRLYGTSEGIVAMVRDVGGAPGGGFLGKVCWGECGHCDGSTCGMSEVERVRSVSGGLVS